MRGTLALLLAAIPLFAAISASPETVDELIARGDRLDLQNRNAQALPIYLEAEKLDPKNVEILRRIAKQYAQILADTSDAAEKKKLGESAVTYAKCAVAAAPENAKAHLALAICYGRASFMQSARERVETSRKIKDEVDASLKLDPADDYAWHVLGRWNYEMTNFSPALRFFAQAIYGKFPDASNERAIECFKKAIACGPPRVIHFAELGRTYAAVGEKNLARTEIQKALALPSKEKDDEETKRRARETLRTL